MNERASKNRAITGQDQNTHFTHSTCGLYLRPQSYCRISHKVFFWKTPGSPGGSEVSGGCIRVTIEFTWEPSNRRILSFIWVPPGVALATGGVWDPPRVKFWPNLDPISKFWPNFKILTQFQNFDQISKFWPNFKILTKFQNFDQILEFRPNFKILTKFSNVD